MIFMSIPIFIFLIICCIGSLSGVGIVAYKTLIDCHQKALAELLFFVLLCTIILIIICVISIIIYSKKKNNVLKRINRTARINGSVAVEKFTEFGKLGQQIQTLFADILNVSQKRSLKVVYLDNMIRSILNSIQKSSIIIDSKGFIQYCSSGYRKIMDSKAKNVLGSNFTSIYPELPFDEIINQIEKVHSDYNIKAEENIFNFFPIFSSDSAIAGIYVVIEKKTLLDASGDAVKQIYDNIKKPASNIETVTNSETAIQEPSLVPPKKSILDFFKLKK